MGIWNSYVLFGSFVLITNMRLAIANAILLLAPHCATSFQVIAPLSASTTSASTAAHAHLSLRATTLESDASVSTSTNPLAALFDKVTSSIGGGGGTNKKLSAKPTPVEQLIDAINNRDAAMASQILAEDCTLTDTRYYDPPIEGRNSIRRHIALEGGAFDPSQMRIIDEIAVDADGTTICTQWHTERDDQTVENERGCSFYTVDVQSNQITSIMDVPEPKSKPGDSGLALLDKASQIIDKTGVGFAAKAVGSATNANAGATSVERYFDAWNRRDMQAAVECFAVECTYEDTQYDYAFEGKGKLEQHLLRVADCLPTSFAFVVDNLAISADKTKVGVQWHLENGDGEALPFTRGVSFYKVDERTGLIVEGFDVPEPAVVKPGSLNLFASTLQRKVSAEPVRIVPIVTWLAYMGIVFFSDGILPGANALQLEQRTWEEVRDLSLNFFLVSPIAHLPFAPVVHPMLEGVFNLLLSWAAMFAGFLSDDREEKPNIFPMLPAVAGMQFLTSAFLLPYLALRTSEDLKSGDVVYKEDVSGLESTLGEFRWLGAMMGAVGSGSIAWFFFARTDIFGSEFSERYGSFMDLLSIDRVGSSFIVDLAIFALFQGWLVDDDMRRRGIDIDGGELAGLRTIAKFIPFFGMAAYLTVRPSLPEKQLE